MTAIPKSTVAALAARTKDCHHPVAALSPWRTASGVIPQVAPNWLSYALLRFEINVRASAILGFVGAGGIGYELKIAMQWGAGKYDQVIAIFILLFLTIAVIDALSDRIRRRLTEGGVR